MIFEKAENLTTVIDIGLLERNPKYLFEHFMNYGDEVFYVLKNGSLWGIVTPGDIIRSYQAKSVVPRVNRDFSYVSNQEDYQGAERILEEYPTIHEVAVVRGKVLLGVLRDGSRKNWGEWKGTRECLQAAADELERDEWIKKDIQKLLERKNKIFVYRCLSVEDMGLTEDEQKIYEGKVGITEGRLAISLDELCSLTEREQMDFYGNRNDSSYAFRLLNSAGYNRRIVFKNGIPRLEDKSDDLCNIRQGRRVVPNAPGDAPKKIFMFGPCVIFGGYVEDNQTVEAYLQRQILEAGFEDYEVVNCSAGWRDVNHTMAKMFSEEIGEEDIIILMAEEFELWNGFVGQSSGRLRCLESMREIWREIDKPINHVLNHVMHCDALVSEKIAEKMFRDIKNSLTKEKTDKSTIHRTQLQNYYISWDVVKACRKELRDYMKISGGGENRSDCGDL